MTKDDRTSPISPSELQPNGDVRRRVRRKRDGQYLAFGTGNDAFGL